MAAQLYKTANGHLFHGTFAIHPLNRQHVAGDIAIVFCGLGARGKTYTAHKLSRYLRWLGVRTSIFSIGDYRRRLLGSKDHTYFQDPSTSAQRDEIAAHCLDDLIKFLHAGGQVGIYDGANTTNAVRARLNKQLTENGIRVLFIETICNIEEIVEANIREVKLSSPDYRNMNPDAAMQDFKFRL